MRFSWERAAGLFSVFLITALVVLACDSGTGMGNGGGDDDPTVIEVEVRANGSARSGVTVRLYPSGSQTAQATRQTGTGGLATFANVDAGSYDTEIDVPDGLELDDGETARKSVTVAAEETERVTYDLVGDSPPPGNVVEVTLSGFSFTPSQVTIDVGTTVRWIRQDGSHTVTPRDHSEFQRATLSTAGATFEHTFQNPGDFDYFCEPHEQNGMVGSVTVQ